MQLRVEWKENRETTLARYTFSVWKWYIMWIVEYLNENDKTLYTYMYIVHYIISSRNSTCKISHAIIIKINPLKSFLLNLNNILSYRHIYSILPSSTFQHKGIIFVSGTAPFSYKVDILYKHISNVSLSICFLCYYSMQVL